MKADDGGDGEPRCGGLLDATSRSTPTLLFSITPLLHYSITPARGRWCGPGPGSGVRLRQLGRIHLDRVTRERLQEFDDVLLLFFGELFVADAFHHR